MDEFGSITIDNKNLLDDLLGLESNENNGDLSLYQPRRNYQPTQVQSNNYQSNYLPVQGRKILLESPTFTKKEDDIYRYVHSRISNADNQSRAQNLQDSLDNNGDNFIKRNFFVDNNQRIEENAVEPHRRIGSNKLLSDLAVAAVNKNEFNLTQPKLTRPTNTDNRAFDIDLLDSLDNTSNQNNLNQQVQFFLSNQNIKEQFKQQQQQQQQQQQHIQPQSPHTKLSQPLIDNQFILQQQAQQLQLQTQSILPFQTAPGVILLQSPTSNQIPLLNPNLQFNPQTSQIIPFQFQQAQLLQQQQNMFYQEPLQPVFYNTAYPINIPLQNSNGYYNQQDDPYQTDPYQYQQINLYNQPNNFQPQSQFRNNLQSVSGTKYDAKPLQPPPIPQRVSDKTKTLSQQSNDSYDLNSPDSDVGDIINEYNQINIKNNNNNYNNNNNNNNQNNYEPRDEQDEEIKSQEVWTKLQKAREKRDKNSGLKTKQTSSSTLPTVGSKQQALYKKPPLPENNYKQKNEQNFLEKNVEAIRNKENLTHRYPEKKYEIVHGKNANERAKVLQGTGNKKPPVHLKPIDNYEDNLEDYPNQYSNFQIQNDNFNQNKKISIPIDPSKFKDKDHINLDINLRLVDLLPQQSSNNRSIDDFDVNNDPLARYIRQYETNISRSLPGSSGSLNKLKPLPPLNSRLQKPYSHQGGRLQHEYDNEIRYEDGYLAQLQRAQSKPVIKTYTLKDYRNFKKDALATTNNNTGKLGFDYESDTYKQKVEVTQKKNEYAERVKLRNQILIAEQKKNEENNSVRSQPEKEPSKNQRAKEYVKNNVFIRNNSAPRDQNDNNRNQNSTPTKKSSIPVKQNTPTKSQKFQVQNQTNITKPKDTNKPDDTTIVKIRDPVTSKVRTIYLNDTQIDELSKRHEHDKEKVNNLVLNKNSSNSFQKTEKPRQPIDLRDTKQLIEDNIPLKTKQQEIMIQQNNNNTNNKKENEIEVVIYEKPKKTENQQVKQNQIADDEKFEKLVQRHKNEKKIVQEFDSPYLSQDLENQLNKQNFKNTNKNAIQVE